MSGPFERTCLEDGYWSDREPSCSKPRPVTDILASDNTVDGTKNIRAGRPLPKDAPETSSIGTWIGVALGLIVVIGLLILGLFFYRKKRAITSKPPPYRDRNSNNGAMHIMSGVYGAENNRPNPTALNGSNGGVNGSVPALPARIGQRPPPPIQMYSMDEANDSDQRGPIYDTINDGSTSSAYSRSSASDKGASSAKYAPSTFSPNNGNGYNGRVNGGFGGHEYDVPEGKENGGATQGTVTINGIAV